jgi:hypothetical protein
VKGKKEFEEFKKYKEFKNSAPSRRWSPALSP